MPKYYFDLHNDVDAPDFEGRDLPDLEAVRSHLTKEVRAMLKASIDENGRIDLRHHIDVRDESGSIIHVMHFEDAITIQRGNVTISEAQASDIPNEHQGLRP